MSDIVYDSDEYHDDYLPDLHREGSLPDLVLSSSLRQDAEFLSSSLGREAEFLSSSLGREAEFLSAMNLTGSTPSHVFDPPTDIESEYFTTLDQVTTLCGVEGIRVTYEDHSKIYIPKIRTCDNYRFGTNIGDKHLHRYHCDYLLDRT